MEDGYGAGGLDDGFNLYGDMDQDMSTTNLNVAYDPNDKDGEDRKYSAIVRRFRVIMPADVEKMLEDN